MKKLFTLMIIASSAMMASCQQQPSPQPTTPTPTTPPASTLTAQEQTLVGKWTLDKMEYYVNGSMAAGSPTLYSNPSLYYMQFKSTETTIPGYTGQGYKDGVDSRNSAAPIMNAVWKADNNILTVVQHNYEITTLTSTNLVFTLTVTAGTSTGVYKYYLHK